MRSSVNAWHSTQVARFLFVVLPLPSHFHAALAVGQALTVGGHQVAWCGPESDLRAFVGPDAVVYPTGKRYYREYAESGMAALRVLWTGYLVPFNRFILGPVEQAVAAYRPDVLVADQYALAGALVADRSGLCWASLCLSTLELTPPAEPTELAGFVATQLEKIRGWRAGADDLDLRFSPYLNIALTTAVLTGSALLPAHTVLVGPALGARPTDPDFAWPDWDPTRQHLLVTVGTLSDHVAADFYRRMVVALEPLAGRVQAVFVAPADAVVDAPAHILVRDRVPMLDLLSRLDAVVCHAGMGTVTEALAHGVPLVLAPIRHDQPVVAGQVVAAGAGIAVSFADATPVDLTAAVTAVLDEPRYRDQARRVGDSFAAAGGAPAAAVRLAALADAAGYTRTGAGLIEDRTDGWTGPARPG
jgi:zeaxanthin glucosyltransferase